MNRTDVLIYIFLSILSVVVNVLSWTMHPWTYIFCIACSIQDPSYQKLELQYLTLFRYIDPYLVFLQLLILQVQFNFSNFRKLIYASRNSLHFSEIIDANPREVATVHIFDNSEMISLKETSNKYRTDQRKWNKFKKHPFMFVREKNDSDNIWCKSILWERDLASTQILWDSIINSLN